MSAMKHFAELVSIEMGYDGELNEEVLAEAQYRMLLARTDGVIPEQHPDDSPWIEEDK